MIRLFFHNLGNSKAFYGFATAVMLLSAVFGVVWAMLPSKPVVVIVQPANDAPPKKIIRPLKKTVAREPLGTYRPAAIIQPSNNFGVNHDAQESNAIRPVRRIDPKRYPALEKKTDNFAIVGGDVFDPEAGLKPIKP